MEKEFIRYYGQRENKRDRKGNRDQIEDLRMEMVLWNINRCIKRIEGDEVIMRQKMKRREG